VKATKILNSPNYHLNVHNKIGIPLSLSRAFIPYPNIITSILFLSEGRAGTAWESSKKNNALSGSCFNIVIERKHFSASAF
jgi:hypothetical protein